MLTGLTQPEESLSTSPQVFPFSFKGPKRGCAVPEVKSEGAWGRPGWRESHPLVQESGLPPSGFCGLAFSWAAGAVSGALRLPDWIGYTAATGWWGLSWCGSWVFSALPALKGWELSNPRPCVCSQTLWARVYSVRDPLSSQKDCGWRSKVIAQRALQNFNILKQEASARKHSIV